MSGNRPRILVIGDDALRADVAAELDATGRYETDDGDPHLGDLVMYVRLEGLRYDAFLFLGQASSVTRGALAVVAQRAVLAPLVARIEDIDPLYDGYLYRLPRALVFRDDRERELVLVALPRSAETPSEVVGRGFDDLEALDRALRRATSGTWAWASFVAGVEAEVATAGLGT